MVVQLPRQIYVYIYIYTFDLNPKIEPKNHRAICSSRTHRRHLWTLCHLTTQSRQGKVNGVEPFLSWCGGVQGEAMNKTWYIIYETCVECIYTYIMYVCFFEKDRKCSIPD